MSFVTQHFTLFTTPYSGEVSSAPQNVLVCLDIQQNQETHQPFLDFLAEHYRVYCLVMTNQSQEDAIFHWNPSPLVLQQELSVIATQFETSIHCCISQGFAATIGGLIKIQRTGDILCNPSLPTKDIAIARLLSRLLWKRTATTPWFQQLIQKSWTEQLQWPLSGPSPWISPLEREQERYPLSLSNGTWKQILTRILDANQEYISAKVYVFLGSESAVVPGDSSVQLQQYFSNSIVQHCIFYGERQELLLADQVQRDILQTCKEYL